MVQHAERLVPAVEVGQPCGQPVGGSPQLGPACLVLQPLLQGPEGDARAIAADLQSGQVCRDRIGAPSEERPKRMEGRCFQQGRLENVRASVGRQALEHVLEPRGDESLVLETQGVGGVEPTAEGHRDREEHRGLPAQQL
jgi:hypothetical protein